MAPDRPLIGSICPHHTLGAGHEKSERLIEHLRSAQPRFRTLLDRLMKQPAARYLSLQSFLIMPVERIFDVLDILGKD